MAQIQNNYPTMNPFHNQNANLHYHFGEEAASSFRRSMGNLALREPGEYQSADYVARLPEEQQQPGADSTMDWSNEHTVHSTGGADLTGNASVAMSSSPPHSMDPVDVIIQSDDAIITDDLRRWSIRKSQLIDPADVARVFEPRCVPTNFDVLCGRGGISNHEGNQAYLRKKEQMQERYKRASDKAKYAMSLELVAFVTNRGGRFLERDREMKDVWYQISSEDARKKASQALRDHNTCHLKRQHRARTNFDDQKLSHLMRG